MKKRNLQYLAVLAAVTLTIFTGCGAQESAPVEPSQSDIDSGVEQVQPSKPETLSGNQEVSQESSSEQPPEASGEQAQELSAQVQQLLELIENGEDTMETYPEIPFSSRSGTENLERVDQWMEAVAAREKDAFAGELMGSVSPEIYTLEYDGDTVTMTVYLPIPGQQPRQEQAVEIWQAPDFYLLRGTEMILTIPRTSQPSQQHEKEVSGEPVLASQDAQELGMELYLRLQNPDVMGGPYGIFLPKEEQRQENVVLQEQKIVMVNDAPVWKLILSDMEKGGNVVMLCLGGEQGEKAWMIEQVDGMLVPLATEEQCQLLYRAG